MPTSSALPPQPDEEDNASEAEPANDNGNGNGRGRNGHLLAIVLLFLPKTVAFGALTLITGRSAARRLGARSELVASLCGTGCATFLLLLTRSLRRAPAENTVLHEVYEEGVGWCEAVRAVGQMLQRFSKDLVPRFGILDKRLLLLSHDKTFKAISDSPGHISVCSSRIDKRAVRYCDFAMSTYGYVLLKTFGMLSPMYDARKRGTNAIEVARWHLRIDNDDYIYSNKLDGQVIGIPRHFIAFDEETSSIVVSIRGTNSVSDLVTDLLCETVPFSNGVAHGGMADAARKLFQVVDSVLKSQKYATRRNKYPVVVTGHSLGGGVALLLTKIMLDAGYHDTACFAFAPCPVFGPFERIDPYWSDANHCFVHRQDIVASLSLASARRLALEIERTADATDNTAGVEHEFERNIHRHNILEKTLHKTLRNDPRMRQVDKLYIPTRNGIHWLLPSTADGHEKRPGDPEYQHEHGHERWDIPRASRPRSKYKCVLRHAKTFDRMLITSKCIPDHFPSSYVQALVALTGQVPRERKREEPARWAQGGFFFGELGEL